MAAFSNFVFATACLLLLVKGFSSVPVDVTTSNPDEVSTTVFAEDSTLSAEASTEATDRNEEVILLGTDGRDAAKGSEESLNRMKRTLTIVYPWRPAQYPTYQLYYYLYNQHYNFGKQYLQAQQIDNYWQYLIYYPYRGYYYEIIIEPHSKKAKGKKNKD